MSRIHAVLLVPEESDPLGLLADGVCGARPPHAAELQCFDGHHRRWTAAGSPDFPPCGCTYSVDEFDNEMRGTNLIAFQPLKARVALVLAWGGEVHHHGCMHACPVKEDGFAFMDAIDAVEKLLRVPKPHAAWLPPELRGTIVLLNENGHEVPQC